MEKIIWVIDNNRNDVIDIQRKINGEGSMKAFCMLSFDALYTVVNERINSDAKCDIMPSLIIVDYILEKSDERILKTLKGTRKLAGVPMFFVCTAKDDAIEEECWQKGALALLSKPISPRGLVRIERGAWQYENTRHCEMFFWQQALQLEHAQEIFRLNSRLEKHNDFLRRVFGRYFSGDVLEFILNRPEDCAIGGDRKQAAVLCADLRGFSSIAEEMKSDAMTDMLNEYFGRMTDIIMEFHGTIIEFMGDGILAVFGVIDGHDYRREAMAAAICMQNEMLKVNEFCGECGYPDLEMGIGLHCGEVFIGNVGSRRLMRYNVLGSVVNECSRIESYSVGGQVLISSVMRDGMEADLKTPSKIMLAAKGIKKPLEIYTLGEVRTDKGTYTIVSDAASTLRKVEMAVYIELTPVKNKIVSQNSEVCRLVKLSMNEALLAKMPLEKNCLSCGGNTDGETLLEPYMDVMVTAYLDDRCLFEQVYAKLTQIENEEITLRFTHINHHFKKFVKEML